MPAVVARPATSEHFGECTAAPNKIASPFGRLTTIEADHQGTPAASAAAVLSWLKMLPGSLRDAPFEPDSGHGPVRHQRCRRGNYAQRHTGRVSRRPSSP